jgi:hypothetical protein
MGKQASSRTEERVNLNAKGNQEKELPANSEAEINLERRT